MFKLNRAAPAAAGARAVSVAILLLDSAWFAGGAAQVRDERAQPVGELAGNRSRRRRPRPRAAYPWPGG